MKALAVIDENLAIGRNNDLLFHLPTDLAHFKKHTLGQTVIMGRKTLESMPKGKALPGRNTLVLSTTTPGGLLYEVAEAKGVESGKTYVCCSFQSAEELRSYLKENKDTLGELILAGGGAIYKLFLEDCDELILTEVEAKAEGADTFFPEYREKFALASTEGPFYDGDLKYCICTYKKK